MAKDHKSFKSLFFCNCRVKKKKKPLILKLIILNYVFLKAKYLLLSHWWLIICFQLCFDFECYKTHTGFCQRKSGIINEYICISGRCTHLLLWYEIQKYYIHTAIFSNSLLSALPKNSKLFNKIHSYLLKHMIK